MKFLGSSKITRQNQISLPFEVRNKLEVALGDQVIFVEDKDGRIILTKDIALPD
ncbi:MAG: AbrB/MazE/SpoVT family DNA-binding domain-containing protein [Asgard group archaeon]|nr:AbrB/MazE/SpoVT family DNA-binding domain-containing protein [Asgard group archaeon]